MKKGRGCLTAKKFKKRSDFSPTSKPGPVSQQYPVGLPSSISHAKAALPEDLAAPAAAG